MRRAVRVPLLLALTVVVAAAVGSGVYCAVVPRLAALASWNLDVDRAMDAAGVAPGMIVGEAGAGDGYFTLPMARRVGPSVPSTRTTSASDSSTRSPRTPGATASPNIHVVEGAVDDPLLSAAGPGARGRRARLPRFQPAGRLARESQEIPAPRRRGGHHRRRSHPGPQGHPLLAARANPGLCRERGLREDESRRRHLRAPDHRPEAARNNRPGREPRSQSRKPNARTPSPRSDGESPAAVVAGHGPA